MIPIYRAKAKDRDGYVQGWLAPPNLSGTMFIVIPDKEHYHPMDYIAILNDTLSIHMEDMLDKKNKPIFTSLSEDGKGGDIILIAGGENAVSKYMYKNIYCGLFNYQDQLEKADIFEVIGIYEGKDNGNKN